MTDEGQPKEDQEQIKTAADLKMEELIARMDRLENENRELRQANKDLYAAAREHTQTDTAGTQTDPTFTQIGQSADTGPDEATMSKMEDAVFASWHLTKSKKE